MKERMVKKFTEAAFHLQDLMEGEAAGGGGK